MSMSENEYFKNHRIFFQEKQEKQSARNSSTFFSKIISLSNTGFPHQRLDFEVDRGLNRSGSIGQLICLVLVNFGSAVFLDRTSFQNSESDIDERHIIYIKNAGFESEE